MRNSLIENERGATAIEYSLIAARMSLACIIAFQPLGLDLANVFDSIANGMP